MKSILIKLKGHPHVQKGTAYTILFAMGFCHLLNDMIQSVIPAMYPVLKDNFGFTFAQIGIITLDASGWNTEEPQPIIATARRIKKKFEAKASSNNPVRVKHMPPDNE